MQGFFFLKLLHWNSLEYLIKIHLNAALNLVSSCSDIHEHEQGKEKVRNKYYFPVKHVSYLSVNNM